MSSIRSSEKLIILLSATELLIDIILINIFICSLNIHSGKHIGIRDTSY